MMQPLWDSGWRSALYCLHPRVMGLSLLPLLLIAALAGGLAYFYWADATHAVQAALEGSGWLALVWDWLKGLGFARATEALAALIVLALATPVVAMLSLLLVALFMTPALVRLVAARRFPTLARKKGGALILSVGWSLSSTLLALVALLVSMPLWFVPPLVLVLPPLIWGWLTYRVMAFDALAEHASTAERKEIFKRHRMALLTIGVICGYLGAAPAVVWASGVVFAAGFIVLVPLAVWIYTLVFAFSSLWFAHYCLTALQTLRAQAVVDAGPATRPPAPPLAPEQTRLPLPPDAPASSPTALPGPPPASTP